MSSPHWHLAVVNIAKPLHDLDSPEIAEFMDNLEHINKLGDNSPGAVWRYQDESGAATDTRVFDDSSILINYTIWESVESLKNYVYAGEHLDFFKRRSLWFAPLTEMPAMVLWWIPAGSIPELRVTRTKIEHLRDHGPTPDAFTFAKRFDPPITRPEIRTQT
jgi:hypothetical protein